MKTILIVEDDRDISKVLELRLSRHGYDVNIAHDADSALTKAQECQPDVALLDISMPGGDGFLVAEQLRNTFEDIPIVFLTANSRAELRVKAAEIGANGYFEKPYVAKDLVEALDSLV